MGIRLGQISAVITSPNEPRYKNVVWAKQYDPNDDTKTELFYYDHELSIWRILHEFSYVGNYRNYNTLINTVPASKEGRFAYVEDPQGTPFDPATGTGNYSGSGIYFDNGTSWVNANDSIYSELTAQKVVQVNITEDYNLPDSATFYNKGLRLINRSGADYTLTATGSDTIEDEAYVIIYDGETFDLTLVGTNWIL